MRTLVWKKHDNLHDEYIMLIAKDDGGNVTGILFDGRNAETEHTKEQLLAIIDSNIRLKWWEEFE